MRLRTKVLAATTTAALGLGAAFGIGQAGGDDPPPLWSPTTTATAVAATQDQEEAFSVLATTQRTEDITNDQVEALAAKAVIGIDADGARVVGSTAAGPIWLIPVNGGLCLGLENTADTSLGSACEPSVDVIARGTTVGDGTSIYGIAPDGVTTVTVTPTGGATTAVAVDGDGLYTLPFAPARIGVDGPGGLTEFGVIGG